MKLERLHLRCFLEGIEVPVVAANIVMRRDTPATCSIQIIATPLAHKLFPRTVVHLFFADDMIPKAYVGTPGGDRTIQLSNQYERPRDLPAGTTTNEPEVPPDYIRYRLLFTGEVIGLEYVKTANSRSVILQCMDLSNYWDSVMHDRRDGLFPPARMARFQGISQGSFWDLLGGDTGALYDKLSKPPDAFPHVGGYLGGIMHLMEEIYGTYHRRLSIEAGGGRVIGSQNPFAGIAELRLRLLQQVGITPGDSTPMKLLQQQGFGSVWRRSVRGLPQQFSFRVLMQALMQYTFYSVYPLCTPKYVPPTGTYAQQMGWTNVREGVDEPEEQNQAVLREAIFNKIRTRITAVKDNFTSLVSKAQSGGVTVTEATAAYNQAQSTAHSMYNQLLTVTRGASFARTYLYTLEGAAKRIVVSVDGFNTIIQYCNKILDNLPAGGGASREARARAVSETGEPAFLYTQLFRPDIWFCAPPRCNVLFPEMYSAVSLARNFLAEPTRLMIKSYEAWAGETIFWDDWYFAPNVPGLLRDRPVIRRSGGDLIDGGSKLANDLMAHEMYTGIVPSFMKMSDREMTIGKYIIDAGQSFQDQSMDYFQRVTNFLFFQSRFANRNVSINGLFNPFIVAGFPMLVIDGATDAQDTRLNEVLLQLGENQLNMTPELADVQKGEVLDMIRGRTGVHYLGIAESVSHTIDASGGGSTNVVLSYARDHRESVEFFGADVVEARNRRRLYRTVQRQMTNQERRDLQNQINQETLAGNEIITNAELACADMFNPQTVDTSAATEAFQRAAADLAVLRQGTTTDQEQIMTKRWVVASFLGSAPQIDEIGPWGGKIKSVRDITDQFVGSTASHPDVDREVARLDEEISRLETEREAYMRKLQALGRDETDDVTRRAVHQSLLDTDNQLAALRRQKSNAQGTVSARYRRLSLYGVYPDGRRLPEASIPSNMIGVAHPASQFGPDVVSYVGSGDIMVTLYAYEIVEDISEGASRVDMPVEDVVRPPWYPEIWLNGRIGGGVYLPLLGTTAITDPFAVVTPGAMDNRATQHSVESLYFADRGAGGESPEMVGSILDGATLEGAVDFLVHTYSKIKGQWDATEFARQYTYRVIASMFDMFGSSDLELQADGTLVRGVEGFHSRAFGPYSDLFGIAPGDTVKLLGIERDNVAARARLDVRGRRHAMVLAYQRELNDLVQKG